MNFTSEDIQEGKGFSREAAEILVKLFEEGKITCKEVFDSEEVDKYSLSGFYVNNCTMKDYFCGDADDLIMKHYNIDEDDFYDNYDDYYNNYLTACFEDREVNQKTFEAYSNFLLEKYMPSNIGIDEGIIPLSNGKYLTFPDIVNSKEPRT